MGYTLYHLFSISIWPRYNRGYRHPVRVCIKDDKYEGKSQSIYLMSNTLEEEKRLCYILKYIYVCVCVCVFVRHWIYEKTWIAWVRTSGYNKISKYLSRNTQTWPNLFGSYSSPSTVVDSEIYDRSKLSCWVYDGDEPNVHPLITVPCGTLLYTSGQAI